MPHDTVSGGELQLSDCNLSGTLFAMDRGILSADIIKGVTSVSGNIVGTEKRSSRKHPAMAVFPTIKAAAAAREQHEHDCIKHYISEEGLRSSYWVKETLSNGVVVFHLAYRNGHGKVVLLTTTDESLGPSCWVFEQSESQHKPFAQRYKRVQNEASSDSDNEDNSADNQHTIDEYLRKLGVDVLTMHQRNQIWFLLRMFRFTSYSAYSIILAILKSRSAAQKADYPSESFKFVSELFKFQVHLTISDEDLNNATMDQLKQICRDRKLNKFSNFTTKQTLADFIRSSVGSGAAAAKDDTETMKALLTSWFMKPLKSTKAMFEGSANEEAVLRSLVHFIDHEEIDIDIIEIKTIGLAIDKRNQFIGTSVDGVLLCKFGNDDEIRLIAIEIKTRSSDSTRQHAEHLATVHTKFVVVSAEFGEATFAEAIPHSHERLQIVHHALALNVRLVLYVETTVQSIVRCVLVSVPDSTVDHHKVVLTYIKDQYFPWAYSMALPIPLLSTDELSYCSDMHTLGLTLALWRASHSLFYKNLRSSPFPDIKAIVPAVVAFWNKSKGGVDVVSRYMTVGHSPCRHISIEASLWDRVIMLALLNTFSISKIVDLVQEGHLNYVTTTDALSKRARSGNSFHTFVGLSIHQLREWIVNGGCSVPSQVVGGNVFPVATSSTDSSIILAAPQFDHNTPNNEKRQYYNSIEGFRFRTSSNNRHVFTFTDPRACVIQGCGHRSRFFCFTCKVHLCASHYNGNGNVTCYELFHDPQTRFLPVIRLPVLESIDENTVNSITGTQLSKPQSPIDPTLTAQATIPVVFRAAGAASASDRVIRGKFCILCIKISYSINTLYNSYIFHLDDTSQTGAGAMPPPLPLRPHTNVDGIMRAEGHASAISTPHRPKSAAASKSPAHFPSKGNLKRKNFSVRYKC